MIYVYMMPEMSQQTLVTIKVHIILPDLYLANDLHIVVVIVTYDQSNSQLIPVATMPEILKIKVGRNYCLLQKVCNVISPGL